MITALIQTKDENTLVVELPCGSYALHEQLESIGIRESSSELKISDNEDDAVRIKLFSDSDFGRHLVSLITERDSLGAANVATHFIQHANPAILPDLEQNILYDQYGSVMELIRDIRDMTEKACLDEQEEPDENISQQMGGM